MALTSEEKAQLKEQKAQAKIAAQEAKAAAKVEKDAAKAAAKEAKAAGKVADVPGADGDKSSKKAEKAAAKEAKAAAKAAKQNGDVDIEEYHTSLSKVIQKFNCTWKLNLIAGIVLVLAGVAFMLVPALVPGWVKNADNTSCFSDHNLPLDWIYSSITAAGGLIAAGGSFIWPVAIGGLTVGLVGAVLHCALVFPKFFDWAGATGFPLYNSSQWGPCRTDMDSRMCIDEKLGAGEELTYEIVAECCGSGDKTCINENYCKLGSHMEEQACQDLNASGYDKCMNISTPSFADAVKCCKEEDDLETCLEKFCETEAGSTDQRCKAFGDKEQYINECVEAKEEVGEGFLNMGEQCCNIGDYKIKDCESTIFSSYCVSDVQDNDCGTYCKENTEKDCGECQALCAEEDFLDCGDEPTITDPVTANEFLEACLETVTSYNEALACFGAYEAMDGADRDEETVMGEYCREHGEGDAECNEYLCDADCQDGEEGCIRCEPSVLRLSQVVDAVDGVDQCIANSSRNYTDVAECCSATSPDVQSAGYNLCITQNFCMIDNSDADVEVDNERYDVCESHNYNTCLIERGHFQNGGYNYQVAKECCEFATLGGDEFVQADCEFNQYLVDVTSSFSPQIVAVADKNEIHLGDTSVKYNLWVLILAYVGIALAAVGIIMALVAIIRIVLNLTIYKNREGKSTGSGSSGSKKNKNKNKDSADDKFIPAGPVAQGDSGFIVCSKETISFIDQRYL